MSHPTRLTLDVVMENFVTRRTGVFGKPVWLRPRVLQLVYDDDTTTFEKKSNVITKTGGGGGGEEA